MNPGLTLCMMVKNEVRHLPLCLNSVKDDTPRIAAAYGAQVIPRERRSCALPLKPEGTYRVHSVITNKDLRAFAQSEWKRGIVELGLVPQIQTQQSPPQRR